MTNTANVHDSSPVRSGPVVTAQEHDDKIKGSAAAVSMAEIEELFQTLEDQQSVNKKGRKGTGDDQELIQLITQLIENIEGGGSSQDSAAMTKLKKYAAQFNAGDNSALPKILSLIMPAVMKYTEKNPDDLMGVIKAFAPLMSSTGEKVLNQAKEAEKAFGKFQTLYAASKDPNKGAKLASLFGNLTDSSNTTSINDAFDSLGPEFKGMIDTDQEKAKLIMAGIYQALMGVGIRDGAAATQFSNALKSSGGLPNLMYMKPSDLDKSLTLISSTAKSVGDGKTSPKDGSKIIHGATTPPGGNSGKIIPGKIVPPPPTPQVFFQPVDDDKKRRQKEEEDITQLLAQAMMSLQMLEGMLSKSQANQNKYGIQMNQAKTAAALANMNEMQTKIAKEVKAQKKANEHHWWSWLIKAIVALVAVIVAAVTAGVGAAIAAALIGIFMSTPLMNMTVSAIAKGIAKDLYKADYAKCIKEGKSPEEAKKEATEKSNAVAQVIAQVIVIIAVVVVSFGVGGIEAAGEDAADTAADTAGTEMTDFANVGEDLEEDATSEVADEAEDAAPKKDRFKRNNKLGRKVATFQGISAIGSTNLPMTIMQTDPDWCKKHPGWMAALDLISQIVIMICAFSSGKAAMDEAAKGPQLLESFASTFAKYSSSLLRFNAAMQMADGGFGAYSGAKSASYLADASTLTKEIAKDESELIRTYGEIGVLKDVTTRTNKESVGMIKSDGDAMDALQDAAGSDTDVVNRALQGAS